MASLDITYTIPFGASVRVGYRQTGSSDPFTYISHYPTYNESPYTIDGLPVGLYEVEITTICPNCSGNTFGDPLVIQATVL